MIDQPRLNEEVLINEADGHVLPPALDGAELPIKGMVVGPTGEGQDLYVVSVPSMHDAKLQLHRDQLFSATPVGLDSTEAHVPRRIVAVRTEEAPQPESHQHVVGVQLLEGSILSREQVIREMTAGRVFYMGEDPEVKHVELKDCPKCGLSSQLYVGASDELLTAAEKGAPPHPAANGPRELELTLQALADAADNKLAEVNWPVAIINAVWAARERYEEGEKEKEPDRDPSAQLDRVETMLAEILGVERGEKLSPEAMVDRLKAMRTQIHGGASITFGPPGMLVLRRLIDNEGSAEQYDEISKALDAGIGINTEFEAQRQGGADEPKDENNG